MDEFVRYIFGHWPEWVFGLISVLLATGYRMMAKRIDAQKSKSDAIGEGVQALLRESIVKSYNKYSEKGYCPIYAKESIKRVYAAYHSLGGNDVATELYKKILAMDEDGVKNA